MPRRAKRYRIAKHSISQNGQTPNWAELSDSELLQVRMCDLKLRVEGTPLERRIEKLYQELEAREISFRPHCWFSDEWFSPDGVTVVFTRVFNPSEPDDARARTALFVVGVEGDGDPVRITPESVNPGDGVWSPDGATIVFEVFSDGGRGDTWTIAPDGSVLRNLSAAVPSIT